MLKQLKITQIKSTIGYPQDQKTTIKTLGLGKLHRQVVHNDTPQIRGMIYRVGHLLKVEELKKGK